VVPLYGGAVVRSLVGCLLPCSRLHCPDLLRSGQGHWIRLDWWELAPGRESYTRSGYDRTPIYRVRWDLGGAEPCVGTQLSPGVVFSVRRTWPEG
jgi:hypothetical protein